MAAKNGGVNGEPLERYLKKMVSRWDAALARIDSLERRQDQIMKYLLRREARDQERWKEEQERWKEQQERWEENQRVIREILARLPKP